MGTFKLERLSTALDMKYYPTRGLMREYPVRGYDRVLVRRILNPNWDTAPTYYGCPLKREVAGEACRVFYVTQPYGDFQIPERDHVVGKWTGKFQRERMYCKANIRLHGGYISRRYPVSFEVSPQCHVARSIVLLSKTAQLIGTFIYRYPPLNIDIRWNGCLD